jgi:hypothetical protein
MSAQPIYSDLFAYGRKSIAWLRLYRSEGEDVLALALHPVDQAGAGPINDAEALVSAVRKTFPSHERLRLFTHFVDDPSEKERWIEIEIAAGGRASFAPHPTAALEHLVGTKLPDPADPTCAGLGGEEDPLLALLPPPEPEPDPLGELAVIAVADLPWAHHPFRCHWKERFENLREHYPPEAREHQALGAHWFTTLGAQDFAACRYHQADWRKVAETSVEVLRGLAPDAVLGDAIAAVDQRLGDSPEAKWCRSLFLDPIVCHPGRALTDGQHRSCALRARGAPLCVVAGEDWQGIDPVPGDPRRRAAADISAFWASRAAR